MPKPVFQCAHALVVLSLLGLVGCYAKVEVSDSSAEKAIAIDWVDPPCAVPGSNAGYIEGTGFGAENVTITVDGIPAVVLAATGKDASFVVPEELEPDQQIQVVVENPGGRIATIDWAVCAVPDTDPPELLDFDFNPKSVDVSTGPASFDCTMTATDGSGTGTWKGTCQFTSPSGANFRNCQGNTDENGVAYCSGEINGGDEPGIWEVKVSVADLVGNVRVYDAAALQALGFPSQLEVIYGGGSPAP